MVESTGSFTPVLLSCAGVAPDPRNYRRIAALLSGATVEKMKNNLVEKAAHYAKLFFVVFVQRKPRESSAQIWRHGGA